MPSLRLLCGATIVGAAALMAAPSAQTPTPADVDSIRTLVARLDLERYRATIKGLTAFDR
jgi:hypothetical protein